MQKSTQKVQAGRFPNKTLNTQTQTKRQWEEEMERLNSKYNLDCFSDSELDSEISKCCLTIFSSINKYTNIFNLITRTDWYPLYVCICMGRIFNLNFI